MADFGFRSPRRWLARLSFPFLVFAAILAWEAYQADKGERGPVPQWRITLYAIGAGACLLLGFAGVRERHRSSYDGAGIDSGRDRDGRRDDLR